MKWKFQTAGRLLALLALSGALLAAPLPAQAAPGVLTGLTGTGSKLELELTEMELEITDDDPRPKGYLYTSGQSDYYFIVWMSSNPPWLPWTAMAVSPAAAPVRPRSPPSPTGASALPAR